MPKTEAELWDWVVEFNRHTTHNRDLTSNYGYQAILDLDLVEVCSTLRSENNAPIRILDIGCGSGLALSQLSDRLVQGGFHRDDFECWGMGVNRYDPMCISDDRFILNGLNAHDFGGQRFHLVLSVFAFHYLWHKLECVEKIHNELLEDKGRAYLHFPGYLVRRGESPEAVAQNEVDGNCRFQNFIHELQVGKSICPMQFKTVSYCSDDDDCVLLAEFGRLSFEKSRSEPISFMQRLQAFAMFEEGFAFKHMDDSPRTYVASHYKHLNHYQTRFGHPLPAKTVIQPQGDALVDAFGDADSLPLRKKYTSHDSHPYRITSIPIEAGCKPMKLDVAVHGQESDKVVLICPGACESLEGRVITYADLAKTIVQGGLGAVVRYNDPYDYSCDYTDFLLEKMRQTIEYTLASAEHFCSAAEPRLRLLAYSSSAGAAAALAANYNNIESLLLIAPSYDVPKSIIAPNLARFRGSVHVLIGEDDEVILPQQAYWYIQQATNATVREYVEVPSCGHSFSGQPNKSVFFNSQLWAFGDTRPPDFPPACESPREAW